MEREIFRDKVLLCGPYVGSFEGEIIHFKPFVEWILHNFDVPHIIVSTHHNRSFLYSIENIPIFRHYTKDEESQENHRHKKINSKDYVYLTNEIKNIISKQYSVNKSSIIDYNLGYNKTPEISFFQKRITRYGNKQQSNGNVLFIPDNKRPHKELEKIFNYVSNLYDVEVLGDHKTYLSEHNILFYDINYHNDVYKVIMNTILNSVCVITPSSHWTYICNLHGVPVFSWGRSEQISIYKSTYKFGNTNCTLLPINSKKDVNIIYKGLDKFLKELNVC